MNERQVITMGPTLTRGVRALLIANGAVFLIQALLGIELIGGETLSYHFMRLFGLVPELLITKGFIWQLFTYLFVHGNFLHILLNMFMLWMFGSQLEMIFGTRRFLTYYFACGIGAGIIVVLSSFLFINTYSAPTVGASGAIFGALIAIGMLFPNQRILILPLPITMKMKTAIWITIGIEFFFLFYSNEHGISNTAHLGGALIGYLYFRIFLGRRWGLGDDVRQLLRTLHERRIRRRLRLIKTEKDQAPPSSHYFN